MKRIVSIIVLFAACAGYGNPAKVNARPKYSPEEIARLRAESKQQVLQRTGGEIMKPGVGKGELSIFNGQQRVAASNLTVITKSLTAQFRVPVNLKPFDGKVTDKTAAGRLAELGGNAAVFLIDDETSPNTLLIQPEAHWAIVNMHALTKDNPNDAFATARLKKEMVRGLLLAANGSDSQHSNSLMRPVSNLKQLDDIPRPNPPIDVVTRVLKNLESINVERWEKRTYLDACQEGWAPAPTNDVQKAIWDKVRAVPKEPIQIKP